MFYLITDQDHRTWRHIQWGENITHEEENPNYQFVVYPTLLIAMYMYPAYECPQNPKVWLAEGDLETAYPAILNGIRLKLPKLTTIKEVETQWPNSEQFMNFGILCTLSVVMNPQFKKWAIDYLKGIDRTKETAHKVNQYLEEIMGNPEITPLDQYADPAAIILSAVMLDDPFLAATAAHRAYHDSLELTSPINLEQTASIVNILSAFDIAQYLE